ncbi:substrate-binding domain-containing protein [Vibrio sp. ZSDE26]|uniref:Substrate-binding domain-containing protein n=1 Tax=Vibrio amylolyticus TaxID=2847292 RepID=A0A9X1XP34_9VIBR|nr:substrate-binding domain-containing protein [Vibrio amylolyticus]
MRKKKATVYDVATRANVSVSTVSRYLNRTSFIVKEKVDAIEKAMVEVNFTPKTTQSSAQTKRNMTIGIISPAFDSPFISQILGGVSSEAAHTSYRLELEASNWDPNREKKLIKQLIEQKVDGIILLVPTIEIKQIEKLVGDTPVLFIARDGNGIYPSLLIDNQMGGYIATNHLIQLGHTDIVFVTGTMGSLDGAERFVGYKQSLENAGIEFNSNLVIDGAYESQKAFDSMSELIEQGASFSAVFCANDTSAYGVIQALHQKGIKVPEDVSVIGFDDLSTSQFFIPRLTTIKQPLQCLGQISIKYMLDLISSNTPEYTVPPVTLIERDSCREM